MVTSLNIKQTIVPAERKEATAITVMRCMLQSYAEENNVPFEQALLSFSKSKTYELLFDLDTDVWKEGPSYLRSMYEEEMGSGRCA